MSSDIYAKPDFSKKVRYNKKQQEDKSDWEECEVEIYNDAYESVDYPTGVQTSGQAPQTETRPEVQKRFCRCENWFLLVLCTFLSAGFIILSSYMAVNISNLQREVKEHSKGINQTLMDEIKQLKKKVEGKWCPELWMRFGCSCYYKSTEERSWTNSRTFCQEKGADLLIINSKEEQEFVSKLNLNAESWIGLFSERSSQNRKYEWKWVDGSPLTEMFWDENSSTYPYNSYSAVTLRSDGRWTEKYKSNNKNWICEK